MLLEAKEGFIVGNNISVWKGGASPSQATS